MSNLKSPGLSPNHSAKANGSASASTESEERNVELASQISQISFRSVQEIDHLISGLQGIRQKLDDDGDRIQRDRNTQASANPSLT